MKIKSITVPFVFLLILISCKKENDAGIQIDGNGRPRSVSQATGTTGADLNNTTPKDSVILNGYGIAIDPDGRR